MYLSGVMSRAELQTQHQRSNASVDQILAAPQSYNLGRHAVEGLMHIRKGLGALRGRVGSAVQDHAEAAGLYSGLIDQAMTTLGTIATRKSTKGVGKVFVSLAVLESAKESMGHLQGNIAAILGTDAPIGQGTVLDLLELEYRMEADLAFVGMAISPKGDARLKKLPAQRHFQEANRMVEVVFERSEKGHYGIEPAVYQESARAVVDYLSALTESEAQKLVEKAEGIQRSATRDLWLHVALLAGALLSSTAFGIRLSGRINRSLRGIAGKLTQGAQQMSSASSQVAQLSQNVAEGASEQAASIEETSSSLEELTSMTKRNSDNAEQVDVTSKKANAAAGKGREAMTRMSEAIVKIKRSSDETASIIETIDEIAFQTNLLALNAAVEAARAGEAGKGFAVVAEEVRNLAQRSADAAKNTSALIEESQQNSDDGVAISTEVATILDQIADGVGEVSRLVADVTAASKEQAQGIDQINAAMARMDQVTQSNAASSEESASAGQELSAQAHDLNDIVGHLTAIVSGSAGNQRHHRA